MARYDRVFVGFPIWWYQAPRIIETFLQSYDFAGKTVIPFATSGGSGMGETERILRRCCSEKTKWLPEDVLIAARAQHRFRGGCRARCFAREMRNEREGGFGFSVRSRCFFAGRDFTQLLQKCGVGFCIAFLQ